MQNLVALEAQAVAPLPEVLVEGHHRKVLARDQLCGGQSFIVENPLTCEAWKLDELRDLMNEDNAHTIPLICAARRLPAKQSAESLVLAITSTIGGSRITWPAAHYPMNRRLGESVQKDDVNPKFGKHL